MEGDFKRVGGGTCFPRLEPKPPGMSWSDWCFSLCLLFTRPIFQVIGFLHLAYPVWHRFATYCLVDQGISEPIFFAIVTVATHHIVWFYMNSFFLLIEYQGWLSQFKLPTSPSSEPSLSLKKEAILGSFFMAGPMFIGSFLSYPFYTYFGMPSALAPLPSVLSLWQTFFLVKLTSIITFDLSHRLIHGRSLYKLIHHKHHRKSRLS